MVVFLSRFHFFFLSMDELTMSLSKRVGERVMLIILGVLSLNEEEFVRRTVSLF